MAEPASFLTEQFYTDAGEPSAQPHKCERCVPLGGQHPPKSMFRKRKLKKKKILVGASHVHGTFA
jgi:hypothetical protein